MCDSVRSSAIFLSRCHSDVDSMLQNAMWSKYVTHTTAGFFTCFPILLDSTQAGRTSMKFAANDP